MKLIFSLFQVSVAVVLCCCSNSTHATLKSTADTTVLDSLDRSERILDILTEMPEEIEGNACYLSYDESSLSNEEYIFAGDFNELGFISVSGKIERMEFLKHTGKNNKKEKYSYANDKLKLTISVVKREEESDGTSKLKGKITIQFKYAEEKTVKFVGVCEND